MKNLEGAIKAKWRPSYIPYQEQISPIANSVIWKCFVIYQIATLKLKPLVANAKFLDLKTKIFYKILCVEVCVFTVLLYYHKNSNEPLTRRIFSLRLRSYLTASQKSTKFSWRNYMVRQKRLFRHWKTHK